MKPLLAAIESNDDARIAKANEWFLANINKQAHNAVKLIFKATDHKSRVRAMIITFQLHEYWTVDATPDEKETELETFTAWESRAGLGPDDRDPKYPSFGYLGAIPFGENVIRPILTTWEINPTEAIQGVPAVEVVPEVQTPELAVPKPPEAQQTPTQVVQPSISPILRTLSPEDVSRLYNSLGKDKGHLDVSVTYTINGKPKVGIIKNCLTVVIPDEFLDKILC
jgi:hypothetical protein